MPLSVKYPGECCCDGSRDPKRSTTRIDRACPICRITLAYRLMFSLCAEGSGNGGPKFSCQRGETRTIRASVADALHSGSSKLVKPVAKFAKPSSPANDSFAP